MGATLVVGSATLIVVASLVAEHGLWGMWASTIVGHGLSGCGFWALEHRLSSCGSWAYLRQGMWDLSRPGIEPVSPALVGRFFITEPPEKPYVIFLSPLLSFQQCS